MSRYGRNFNFHTGPSTVVHNTNVDVEFEQITEYGSHNTQRIPRTYRVTCTCGYVSVWHSLGAANEACGRHQSGMADPDPATDAADVVQFDKAVRAEVDRQREAMLAKGDVFADLDDA